MPPIFAVPQEAAPALSQDRTPKGELTPRLTDDHLIGFVVDASVGATERAELR